MSKALTLKQAKSLLKIDETKLEKYLRFFNDDVLAEPDPLYPHKPVLTATEKTMLERYRRVFAMFEIGRTDEWIRSTIQKEFEIDWRQARNIVNEAYCIFGVVGEADREGKKRASISFQRTLANLAFKDKNYEVASKIWEKADKMEGLFDEENLGLNPEDFKHPSTFIFTNNINVLHARQKELDPDD